MGRRRQPGAGLLGAAGRRAHHRRMRGEDSLTALQGHRRCKPTCLVIAERKRRPGMSAREAMDPFYAAADAAPRVVSAMAQASRSTCVSTSAGGRSTSIART